MGVATLDWSRNILKQSFDGRLILESTISCGAGNGKWRVEDEFAVAGIFGKVWPEIDLVQATSTFDVLRYLDMKSIPQIIPGYIQHLGNFEDGDAMLTSVPILLVEISKKISSERFSSSQRAAIHACFQGFLTIRQFYEPDVVELFALVCSEYQE